MGTIFLAGIYGVGKSTLANKLSAYTGIASFSAGDLISKRNGEQYGSNKIVKDKDKNQDILADCVSEILLEAERVILAGHFCIVNKQGQVDILPDGVFDKLQIDKIILLEAPQEAIVAHLSGRDGKNYSPRLIQALLAEERNMAQKTAERLQCPLVLHKMKYSDSEVEELVREI